MLKADPGQYIQYKTWLVFDTHMQLYFSAGNNEDAALNWFDRSNTVKPSDHGRK